MMMMKIMCSLFLLPDTQKQKSQRKEVQKKVAKAGQDSLIVFPDKSMSSSS